MVSADRDALEALFRSTGGDNWKGKANWATDAQLSTWHGIKVNQDGGVVELDLTQERSIGNRGDRIYVSNNLHGKLRGLIPRTFIARLRCA